MARAASAHRITSPRSSSSTTSQQRQLQQQQQQHSMDGGKPSSVASTLQQQERRSQLLALAAGVFSTLLWGFASSSLIVMNNSLYQNGFPFPMMVTGIGQIFTAAAGLGLSVCGLMPLSRGPPSSLREIMRLIPLVACTAGTMFLGNAPYMHLSLSFIQILKAFTPALTLVVGMAAGVERLTAALVLSVLLIALGTGGAVLAESGAPTYSAYGIVLFLGSSLTEGARVVGSQILLGPYGYNSADVLVYVGVPSAVTLIGGSLLFERPYGLFERFAALLPTKPWGFIQAGCMSSVVNLTSYLAISTTSSLTFKVSGCLKNLGVVAYGVVSHGDVVTGRHMLGYAVSLAGFVIYSYSRQRAGAAAAAAAKQAAKKGA